MNRQAQLDAIKGQVGYHEGPSNANKFGPWQGISNAAWCDSFAQWGAVENGGFRWPTNCQFGVKGDAYCPYTEQHAQALRLWRDKHVTPEPGWQVTYDWGGDAVADHIGTVVGVNSDGTIVTVEGNYHDAVQYVKRDRTYVRGFVALAADGGATPAPLPPPAPSGPRTLQRGVKGDDVRQWQDQLNHVGPYGLVLDGDFGPATESATRSFQSTHGCTADGVVGSQTRQAMATALSAPAPAPAPAPPPPPAPAPGPTQAPDGNPFTPLGVDGDFGPQTTKALQWKLGLAADGQFGPASKRALQARIGVTQDGVVGPQTVRALQARVGAGQDGQWGPDTTRHLQDALNRAAF